MFKSFLNKKIKISKTLPEDNVGDKVNRLLSLLTPDKKPNLSSLSLAVKDVPLICLNVKFFGYQLARSLADELPIPEHTEARYVGLNSKTSVQEDIESDWLAHWCRELKVPVFYHRKLWELAYVLQVIHENGLAKPGLRGLGFGCGEEPIASYLASRGVDVTVTDLPPSDRKAAGWSRTNQHMSNIDRVYRDYLIDRAEFDRHVELQYVDMNSIPVDVTGYDFCWSICALEHLGSVRRGLEFVKNSLNTIKPGGFSIHTTEFNVDQVGPNPDNWSTVLFQRKHLEELAGDLRADGHEMAPLQLDLGNGPMDRFVDVPPWHHDLSEEMQQWLGSQAHLKVGIDGFASTCVGLIVRKSRG